MNCNFHAAEPSACRTCSAGPFLSPARAFALLLLLAPGIGSGARADEEIVRLRDGSLLRGTVTAQGEAIVVHAGERDVYLSPAIVAGRERAAVPAEPEPEYVFHEAEAAARKKGKVGLVVDKFRWGGPFDADGRSSVSCVDPKLGAISFAVVVHRLRPGRVELRGVEYGWTMTLAARTMAPLVESLVGTRAEAGPEAMRQAARFWRASGDFAAAGAWLDRAERAEPGSEETARERERLEVAALRAAAAEVEWRAALGDEAGARAAAERAAIGAAAEQAAADEVKAFRARTAALAARCDAATSRAAEFAALTPPAPAPTPAQADRLAAILSRTDGEVPAAWRPALCGEWAEAPARDPAPRLLLEALEAAVGLAARVADFFHQAKPDGAAVVARAFEQAAIPAAWKHAIFRHAARYDPPAARDGFQRIEYEHPDLRRKFHYFVRIPAAYRPDVPCPVLMTLHGQHATAADTDGWWGDLADRHGFLLISPEYIYGRKYGYECSETEHAAVLGALWHASGWLNVDPERVFLQGASQGGHAAWDMGSAHADRFAGVIPIIGAALATGKLGNLMHTGLYCVDGSEDGGSPVLNRKAIQELARLGADARYVEFPGRAHEGFSEEYEALFRWMAPRRAPGGGDEARLFVHCRGNLRRAFVEIAGCRVAPPASNLAQAKIASVTARVDSPSNGIVATCEGVTRLRCRFSPVDFDLAQEVRVTVNGRKVHEGIVKPDWEGALRDAFDRRDRREPYLAEVTVAVK